MGAGFDEQAIRSFLQGDPSFLKPRQDIRDKFFHL